MTDHKPLVILLGPKSTIPAVAAARLQRWAIKLSAYQYDIEFHSTEKHANADCLSRLPLLTERKDECDEAKQINLIQTKTFPITAEQV